MKKTRGRPVVYEIDAQEQRASDLREYQRLYHQNRRRSEEIKEEVRQTLDRYSLRKAYHMAQTILALNGYDVLGMEQIPLEVFSQQQQKRAWSNRNIFKPEVPTREELDAINQQK